MEECRSETGNTLTPPTGDVDHYINQMIDAPQISDPSRYRIDTPIILIAQAGKDGKAAKAAKAKPFQFGGYVSETSSANTSSVDPGSIPNHNFLVETPHKKNKNDSSGEIQRYIDNIVRDNTPQPHHPLIQSRKGADLGASSPDSVKDDFLAKTDDQIQPMQLRHRKLTVPDDGSATFGRHKNPNGIHLLESAIKAQKCQIMRDCMEPAIGVCAEMQYRGCTLAYCESHSGRRHRKKKELICCRYCSSDKHEDICQECSSDILQGRFNFYVITLILSVIIFTVIATLIHVVLQMMPDFCLPTSSDSTWCSSFQQTLHSMNPYTTNAPSINLTKANTALHMFRQVNER